MKIYKNLFALLIFALVCVILFTGCNSAGSLDYAKSAVNQMAEYNDSGFGGAEPDRARKEKQAEYDYEEAYEISASFSMLSAEGSAASNIPAERKIIRDANITIEVEDVEKSYDNILAYLKNFGGYEANKDMQNYGDDNARINATFKVPSGKLNDFLAELKKEGDVKSSSTSSNDITDQYYDSKIRLNTLEKTLDNYYRFLEDAKDVDEQLRVTRYINDITYEIEQIKGSIKLWDSLVDYSTVSLYLYPPYKAPEPVREIKWDALSVEDVGWFISSGFLSVCNAIFSVLQWIVIAVAILSPLIIPAALIVFFIVRRYKKKKKQQILFYQNMQNMQNNNAAPIENTAEANK